MKKALLYGREGSGLRCASCIRRCLIPPGRAGFCNTRKNIKGQLFSLYYGYFSGIRLEPLSSKPFLHFRNSETGKTYSPEEITLSIGGYGCNYLCKGCQNAEVSRVPKDIEKVAIRMTPEEIVETARERNIKIIAFTWNEPAIMPEAVLDVAKLAQQNGIMNVYVSNGSPTKEHIDLIAPYMDAFRYDIKAGPGVGDEFYKNYCNLSLGNSVVNEILDTIKYTKNKGRHIELVTVLVPGHAPTCIRSLLNTARWIKENLGVETPWHLAKFFPAHEFSNPTLKTPDTAIDYYTELVRSFGLKNVYAVKDRGCDCLNPEEKGQCCK
ncbi:radical SAM protein [Candidatus Micrarchaeota archaeon]|nr:radical SAM protein [Candidatus Micrarchaeota archaeon]MBU1939572.1 radical SAM protein [Candidatus Micrarchaeota archaeon]